MSKALNEDLIIGKLARDLFNAARPWWHNSDSERLHACIAEFILEILLANRETQLLLANRETQLDDPTKPSTLAELEKRAVLLALSRSGGNKKAAARSLNVDRGRIDRILRREGITKFHLAEFIERARR